MSSDPRLKWIRIILFLALWVMPGGAPARALQPTTYFVYLPMILVNYSPFWENEPNGSDPRASGPVASGIAYFGVHNTDLSLDSDYWWFRASAAGPYHLSVEGLDSFGQVSLTQRGGAQVGFVGGAPYVLDGTLPASGEYVVRVVSTALMGTQVYTLTVTYP